MLKIKMFLYKAISPVKIFSVLIVIFFVLGMSLSAFAQSTNSTAKSTNSTIKSTNSTDHSQREALITDTWSQRMQDLSVILEDLENKRKELNKELRDADVLLKGFQRDYQRLFALFQLSRTNPSELDSIAEQFIILKTSIVASTSGITKLDANFSQQLDDFAIMQKELTNHLALERTTDLNKSIQASLDNVSQTIKKLGIMRSSLALVLDPSNDLLAKVDQALNQIKEQLPVLWMNFYLTQSAPLFDLNSWTDSIKQLSAWPVLNVLNKLTTPMPGVYWSSIFFRFCFALSFLLGLTYLLCRKIKKNKDDTAYSVHYSNIFRYCLPLLSIGFALYFASWHSKAGLFQLTILFGNLFWLYGESLLAWNLRCIVNDIYSDPHMPFAFLLFPVMLGILLMIMGLPSNVLALSWILVLAVSYTLRHFYRKTLTFLPRFESFALKIEPYIYSISVLASCFGWVHLGIPFFLIMIAFFISIQVGLAASDTIANKSKSTSQDGLEAISHALLIALGTPLVWIVAIISLLPWITALPGSVPLILNLMERNLSVGEASFSFMRIFLVVFMFYITHGFLTVAKAFLQNLPSKIPTLERGVVGPLQTGMIYSVWGIFGLFVLNAVGMSFTSVAVIAGGLSVGIGFGLQALFNNFVSGIILIFGRSLLEGDVIQVGDIWGTVQKIHIRATVVRTFDNSVIFVPNSDLISKNLVNWTNNDRRIRRDITVTVAYNSDIELVKSLLMQIATEQKGVLHYPAPVVFCQNFGTLGMDFTLRVWLADLDLMSSVPSDVRFQMKKVLHANNISIPTVNSGLSTL